MTRIHHSTSETVSAECEHCGAENIFNRRDDLGTTMPIGGKRVPCQSCNEEFWINGDVVASPFEFHLREADRAFDAKRYSACVISLGLCWESFLRMGAQSIFIFHPYFAADQLRRGGARTLNDLHAELGVATRRFTLQSWLNLLANTLIDDVRPTSLDRAAEAIAEIKTRKLGNQRSASDLESIPDPELRQTVRQLYALTLPRLRNRAVHDGYHPSRAEAHHCREDEMVLLFTVKRQLRIGSFNELSAESVASPRVD